MTEPAHVSLFAEMDAAAAAMPPPSRDDLQLKLRQIVRARRPDLSRETWLELFEIWFDRHLGSIRNRHAGAHARVTAFIAQAAGTLPSGDPFVCPSGEVIYGWSQQMERLHAEHIYRAQFDRPQR